MLLQKKEKGAISSTLPQHVNSLDLQIIPQDTTENRFFSFSANTRVFRLSTYTPQKPGSLRQPLQHMKHVGVCLALQFHVHAWSHIEERGRATEDAGASDLISCFRLTALLYCLLLEASLLGSVSQTSCVSSLQASGRLAILR